MKIGFSFFSKTKTMLGILMEMGMEVDDEQEGLPVIQPVVQITFGYVFGYIRFSFNFGKPLSLLEMLKSGDARVRKGTISEGEVEKVEELSTEEVIDELTKRLK